MVEDVDRCQVAGADRANVVVEVADAAKTASTADKAVTKETSTPDKVVTKASSKVDDIVSKAASTADKRQQQGQRDSVTVAMHKVHKLKWN